jgi:all-trans-retinol 13,14-reductase
MEKGKKVIIVGSGIGGLVCGALLSKEGFNVTVLEMNKQIGGNLQSFVRDRRIFDSGVHYVGGLDNGQNLFSIFKYLGIMDKLKMHKLSEDAFDKIVFLNDGKEYDYSQGYPKFIASLVKEFPEEKEGIEKYCKAIQDTCASFPLYQLRDGDTFEKAPYLEIDTKGFIASLTKNERLQNVLAGSNLLYAGVRDKTPFYVHALVINSYVESSWRIVNGGSQIAKLLTRIILGNGGTVKNRTEIKKFAVTNGKVEYVESAEGDKYYADYFISNIHPAKTLELTQTDAIRPAYRNRINSLENTSSAFVIYVTLKPGQFKYRATNYYCFKENDVWESMHHTEETWPLSYALFYSGFFLKSEEYADCLTIMAYMHWEEVEKWKDTFNTVGKPASRGEDYEEFKKQKAEILLDLVEQQFPGLRDSILSYYTATPLTFRDYMGTDDGSIYGIAKDYKDPLKTFISPRTKVENLLLTGQNINLHGVLGVAISSLVTCSVLLGKTYILDQIENAQAEQMA